MTTLQLEPSVQVKEERQTGGPPGTDPLAGTFRSP